MVVINNASSFEHWVDRLALVPAVGRLTAITCGLYAFEQNDIFASSSPATPRVLRIFRSKTKKSDARLLNLACERKRHVPKVL
eukprot:3275470-Amphidinium_carterae.1